MDALRQRHLFYVAVVVQEYAQLLTGHADSLQAAVAEVVAKLRLAWREDRQVFVFGNGGSAANASHFVTDLGKSSSDKLGKRFRVLTLNDNVSWMTAIGNDYAGYLKSFAALKGPVDAFFEKVMVNAEDANIRNNRLALLRELRDAMNRVADLSKLAL